MSPDLFVIDEVYSAKMTSAIAASLPAISPMLEMGAYEALWAEKNATFKTIADKFPFSARK